LSEALPVHFFYFWRFGKERLRGVEGEETRGKDKEK
jgi:hypothetical protein